MDSNTKKMNIHEYIQKVIEPSESIQKYNDLKLKPSLKYSQYNNEDWEKVKAIVNVPDTSKVMCIQSTYSYSFYIYNSPKHGLVEIIKSNFIESISNVTSISYEYLVHHFRHEEIKMTFNRYLSEITSEDCTYFMTNPTLKMNDTIRDFVESKRSEIKSFKEKSNSYNSDETPEIYLQNLYITLGNIDDIPYFVTKTKVLSDEFDRNTDFLVLFAQLDEHTFVSTHIHI